MKKLKLLLMGVLLALSLITYSQDIRVYKGSDGNFRMENDIIPIANYRLVYNGDQTKAKIENVNLGVDLIRLRPISDFQNQLGVPYSSTTEFESALNGLFGVSIVSLLDDPGFSIKAALGQINGVSVVNKFGENDDIDTGTDPEDVWDFGGIYNFSSIADINTISCTGTDAIEITIEGLDSNWDEVQQTVILTGQTKVTLLTPLIRVIRAYNSSSVNLVGNVYIYADTPISNGIPIDTSKIRALIKAESNQTEMLIYSVPAGKTIVYVEGFFAMSRGGQSITADMTLRTRLFGKVFRTKRRIALNSQGSSSWRAAYTIAVVLPEKSDVLYRCETVSANNTGIAGGFQAYLLDNEIWGL